MTENTKVISPWGRLEVILARKPGKGALALLLHICD